MYTCTPPITDGKSPSQINTANLTQLDKQLLDQDANDYIEPSQIKSVLAPHDSNGILLIDSQPFPPVVCSKGFWTYTQTGGVLEVYVTVNSFVQKGMLVARIKDIFGNVQDESFAPCDGMVIGRSSNPVAMAGDRIIHWGVVRKRNEQLPLTAKENY